MDKDEYKDEEEGVSELLDAIVWGHRIIEVWNEEDQKTFVFRPLTLEERNMGNFVYKSAYKRNLAKELLPRKALVKRAIKEGHWKASYEEESLLLRKEYEKVLDELDKAEVDNKKRRKPTATLVRLRRRVEYIQDTLMSMDAKRVEYIEIPSAERHAESERGNYYLHCSTLMFPEMEPLWPSLNDLESEENINLATILLGHYYNETIADESAIRRIARSGIWRCKWMGSKKNLGVKTLFGRDMFELTTDQFRLMYWSQIYDSAYASMEPPSDAIIEDDKLFDRWLDEQHQKREREAKTTAFNKKVSHLTKKDANEVCINVQGEFSEECSCGILEQARARGAEKLGHIHDPSCSYGVYLYYSKEHKMQKVEDVQSANSERVRRTLGAEQGRLSKVGVDGVQEQHLRDHRTRTTLGLPTKVHGPGEHKGR